MKALISAVIVLAFCGLALGQAGSVVAPVPPPSSQSTQPSSPQAKSGSTQAADQKGTARIEGTVVTLDGERPVRKATVTLMPVSQQLAFGVDPRREFTTEADGKYKFEELAAGTYRISVQHPNFVGTGRQARNIAQSLTVTDGQQMKDINFRLVPAAIIRGVVSDEDGDPMPRVQVSVMRQQYVRGRKQYMQSGSTNTDDRGEYRISSLAPGSYWIAANRGFIGMPQSPDAAKASKQYVRTFYPGATEMESASPVDVRPGDEAPANITMMKKDTAPIHGTVTLPTGEKPQMAMISMSTPNDPSPMGQFSAMVREGVFDLRVPPGHYRMMVMTSDAQPAMPTMTVSMVDVPPQGIPELKLQTSAGSKVTAHFVVEGATQAVALDNFRVQLMVHRDDDDARQSFMMGDFGNSKADKEGLATVERMNPGNYDANFYGVVPGMQDTYLKSVIQGSRDVLVNGVRVAGDTTIELVVSVNGGKIEGVVTDGDHKPMKGATVVDVPPAEFRSRDQFWRSATSDQNGKFTLHSIRPGRHVVIALDDPEPGVWMDPEFLKNVESRGESLSVGEKEAKQIQLQVIPKDKTAVGQ